MASSAKWEKAANKAKTNYYSENWGGVGKVAGALKILPVYLYSEAQLEVNAVRVGFIERI